MWVTGVINLLTARASGLSALILRVFFLMFRVGRGLEPVAYRIAGLHPHISDGLSLQNPAQEMSSMAPVGSRVGA